MSEDINNQATDKRETFKREIAARVAIEQDTAGAI